MEICCDLEVDINGEETFMVDKRILSSYSGKLSRLFRKSSKTSTEAFKVIFHDFPGGPESFELISRFCYSNGGFNINPYSILHLYYAAQCMEMNDFVLKIENSFEGADVGDWTWAELLAVLKPVQELPIMDTVSSFVEKCISSLVVKMSISNELSSCASTSSSESSVFRVSCDTRSTESFKTSFFKTTWWFGDFLSLSPIIIESVMKSMAAGKFDHNLLSRFLFYYQKSKTIAAKPDKCKNLEAIVNILYTLDWKAISCKSLFGILQNVVSLKISKSCRKKLEIMIGCQLDQATLDNLLVPCKNRMNGSYDVNLVLRLVRIFIHEGNSEVSIEKMKRVCSLMDLYMTEVAPDPGLKPSKFLALALTLPDLYRESHDKIYRAIDIYLEVHAGLSDEERKRICLALMNEKLSNEVQKVETNKKTEQIVVCSVKPDYFSDQKEQHRTDFNEMQFQVRELKKVHTKMQTPISTTAKSRMSSSYCTATSLPRLCS